MWLGDPNERVKASPLASVDLSLREMLAHMLGQKIDERADLRCQVSIVRENCVDRRTGRDQWKLFEDRNETAFFEFIAHHPSRDQNDTKTVERRIA